MKRTFETVAISNLRAGDQVEDEGRLDSVSRISLESDGYYILWRSIRQADGEFVGPYAADEKVSRVLVERMNAA
jgi:hypothetical protein